MSGTGSGRWAARGTCALGAVLLVLLTLAFWKLRMVDVARDPAVGPVTIDVFTDHVPQANYVFSELSSGRLPLWNPYQLAGSPLLAVPSTGSFYPPNWLQAAFELPLALELLLILHSLFGLAGMLLLMRRLEVGWLAALAAALSFVWSGHVLSYWPQPVLMMGTMWFPWTAWLLLQVIDGSRGAWLGLVASVALQWFLGATEVTVHVLQAGALVSLVFLVDLAHRDAKAALARAGWVAAAVGLGTALAAIQLAPSMALVGDSVRTTGSLEVDDVAAWGLAPGLFLRWTLGGQAFTPNLMGLLPALGLCLGLAGRGSRRAWIAGAALALVGAFLAFGGDVFRLYASLPGGTLFRRPSKFVDVYSFGAAVLAGLAVEGLLRRSGARAAELLRDPGWLLALALACGVAGWVLATGSASRLLLAPPLLLAGFALLQGPRLRRVAVAALVAAHGLHLFFEAGSELRPWHRRELYAAGDPVWAAVAEQLGDGRVHVSERLRWQPGYMPKQGMLRGIDVLGDYQPLSQQRYADYFDRVTMQEDAPPFYGNVALEPYTRWRMLDLLGTRLYVVNNAREARNLGMLRTGEFRLVHREASGVQLYRRDAALPRAWLVDRVQVVGSADEALRVVAGRNFDPRALVVVEQPASEISAPEAPITRRDARVRARRAQDVLVETETDASGFLVLAELYTEGWQATLDGKPVELLRANHLLRAVRVPAGRHEVRFVYRPRSLRIGSGISAAALLASLAAFTVAGRRRS